MAEPLPVPSAPSPRLPFRPEIQGLRGLAVLGVLLYHAGIAPFLGGFVGVDVFFVISGFLIGGIVRADLEKGSFRFVDFFARRVKRLYPAFVVFLLLCVPVMFFLLHPWDFLEFFRSLRASLQQGANVFFHENTDYFALDATQLPLLHLWSIAVEWQFYLVFPFALWLIHRVAGRWTPVVVAGVALPVLFLLGFKALTDAKAAFFLFPHRAWELWLGAAVVYLPKGRLRGRLAATALILGALFLLAPMVAYGYWDGLPFPGPAALIPTLGGALWLYAYGDCPGRAKQLMAARPLVYVGEISYSLYLFHWPLFALGHYRTYLTGEEPGWYFPVAALAVSFGLAAWSHRFVETPGRRLRFGPWVTLGLAVLASGLVWLVAYTGRAYYNKLAAVEEAPVPETNQPPPDCYSISPPDRWPHAEALNVYRLGPAGPEDAPLDFLLIGDSHAGKLGQALHELALRLGKRGVLLGRGVTLPGAAYGRDELDTSRFFLETGAALIRKHRIPRVIMTNRWSVYRKNRKLLTLDGQRLSGPEAVMDEALRLALSRFRAAGAERIWATLPVPEHRFDVQRQLYFARREGSVDLLMRQGVMVSQHDRHTDGIKPLLSAHFGARLLDVPGLLLSASPYENIYPTVLDGQSLYVDTNHLTLAGARLLLPLFEPVLLEAAPARVPPDP